MSDYQIVVLGLLGFIALCVAFIAYGLFLNFKIWRINRSNPIEDYHVSKEQDDDR